MMPAVEPLRLDQSSSPGVVPTTADHVERRPRRKSVRSPLNGLLGLPSIDQLLQDQSVRMIQECGVSDFVLRGGVLRPDGAPSLASPSSEANQQLRQTIESHGGFWFSDDAGTHWAVLVPAGWPPDKSPCAGIAVGFPFSPALLEAHHRQTCLKQTHERIHSLQPHLPGLGPGMRNLQARRLGGYRLLQSVDHALRLTPLLLATACARNDCTIKLSPQALGRALWGTKQSNWPTDSSEILFQALSVLSEISTLELTLPKVGWCPTPRQRGRALHSVQWLPGGELLISLDPIFTRFVDRWLPVGAASKPRSPQP
jgi:hypothetical protein